VKGIDPYGTSYYSGLGRNMTNVYGHRDVSSTACPGDTAYPYLDELRTGIANRLGNVPPPPSGPQVGDTVCFYTGVNIRTGPCTTYAVAVVAYAGDRGVVVGAGQTTCSYTWYQLTVKGVTGYAAYDSSWWNTC